MKSLVVLFLRCTKGFKINRLKIVQTPGDDKDNGGFFLFSKKDVTVYSFFEKICKILDFTHHHHVF
jgi:hypothetical protein